MVTTSSEHAFSVCFHVTAVDANNIGMLTVQINQQVAFQLLGRVRVTLRDQQQRLLISQLTTDDGKVSFPKLATGLYWVEIKHSGTLWQQPVLLTLDLNAP